MIAIPSEFQRDYIFIIKPESDQITWLDANEYCYSNFDSTLATITTPNDFSLAHNYSSYGGYIGLHDPNDNNQWEWLDGTPCDEVVSDPNNTQFCSDYLEPNPDYNSTINDTEASCSIIPSEGHIIHDYDCNITTDNPSRFYCNKGNVLYLRLLLFSIGICSVNVVICRTRVNHFLLTFVV